MSKVKYVLLSALMLLFMICVPINFIGNKVYASNDTKTVNVEQIKGQIKNELEALVESGKAQDAKERDFRVPGSKEEYNTAMYIHGILKSLTRFEPVNDGSTNDGIQNFNFKSDITGNNATSQNIVFRREGALDKKVVLAVHYDSAYVYELVENQSTGKNEKVGIVSDGINDNAASIALLLTLAKNLDAQVEDFGYDLEIVFFGAGTNDYAGSRFYNQGKSDKDCEKTLLMINFDKIALGDYVYAYVNEFESPQENYFNKILKSKGTFKKLKSANALDTNSSSPNGLNYTHIGLEGDHAIFMSRNINVLSFISGNYEGALTFGYNEKENGKNVTYTENDNYSYILTNYTNIYQRLADIYNGVNAVLFDEDFIPQMEKDSGLESKYEFWTNEKLAVFITAMLLIVFIAIYYIIYRNLLNKSRKRITDSEIDKIVIKITSNLGEDDKQINDIIDGKINDDIEDKKDNE